MPDGKGRGDGDIGSAMNPHIGYLETTINGEDVIKPYLRTSSEGRKVRPKDRIEYDEVKYFKLVPITGQELADIKKEEKDGKLQDLANRDAYIKVIRIKRGGWLNNNGYGAMKARSWAARLLNPLDPEADKNEELASKEV